ncbi:MAG: transcription termination/antitermination protein NusG [SAR324 cluster bacterium]|nr:transcription termination/antitermination protein NusG [SAR324 cluster bacterium]MBL7035422.1 transcription termination/antitermination protein NusG [SAR324 cluster bacterium]
MTEEQTGPEIVLEEQDKVDPTPEITADGQQKNVPAATDVGNSSQNKTPEEVEANAEGSAIEENQDIEIAETEESEKPQNPNAKWYILQAYAGYEGRVEQTINEKLRIKGIQHLVDEIFIPSEDIISTKEGKKRKVNKKYFPGYVLIRMELTPELWHLLMDVNRVSGFIGGTQKNPLPLDERELEEIRAQVNEGFQQKATEDEFTIGQKVTITEGSFGNFSGIIDEINLERRKLKVLVSIFGRPTPVEVEFEKVKHVVE